MKIPEEIIVSGLKWKIEICDKPSDVDSNGHSSLSGQTDYWKQRIAIYKDQPERMWQTFFHELLHVFFWILSEKKLRCDEKLIDTLAFIMNDTFFRNKIIK